MDDGTDLTPWEDINPPMASAQRRALPCASSDRDEARKVFRNELTACLTLVAPAGMTEEARGEWLAVAWDSLKHIPPHILRNGALVARQKCDHPSKIVPTIIEATDQQMRWLNDRRGAISTNLLPAPSKRHVLDRRGEPMSEADTTELNSILEKLGATKRYREDGSKFDAISGR